MTGVHNMINHSFTVLLQRVGRARQIPEQQCEGKAGDSEPAFVSSVETPAHDRGNHQYSNSLADKLENTAVHTSNPHYRADGYPPIGPAHHASHYAAKGVEPDFLGQ